jgi:gamma-glutamylcyclotransferase (GGCT)/AIG2-like uncharacterized protein YtfP
MNDLVFVYGTLMLSSGHPMGVKLASEADFIGIARVQGRLYDFGKWPGLSLSDEASDIVYGEAWRLRSPASLAWMDEYEGIRPGIAQPEYERIQHRVTIEELGTATASLYAYRWPIDYHQRILSGRWMERTGFRPTGPQPRLQHFQETAAL